MKTSELTGATLDWAVAKCEGIEVIAMKDELAIFLDPADDGSLNEMPINYSSDWAQGGAIIEREEIELHVIPEIHIPENWADCKPDDKWCANIWPQDENLIKVSGPTPLIAAMRCYVASKLGDEVEVPEELLDSAHG